MARCTADDVLYESHGFFSRIEPYVAIFIHVVVIVVLILVIPCEISLHKTGPLSNHTHTLYVVGTTVIASIIAAYTADVTRHVWLSVILKQRQDRKSTISSRRIQRARTLLGLGDFWENFRFLDITVCVLSFGLLVTTIVAGVTPKNVLAEFPFTSRINLGPDTHCFSMAGPEEYHPYSYRWLMPNGSQYQYNAGSKHGCGIQKITPIIDRPVVPASGTGYTLLGLPVAIEATGTPADFNLGFGPTFGVPNSIVGSMFESSTACLPNIIETPYRCHEAGNVTWDDNLISSVAKECLAVAAVVSLGGRHVEDATIFDLCPRRSQLGTANLILAGNGKYAKQLANAMDRPTKEYFIGGGSGWWRHWDQTFSAVCAIDVAPTVGFRQVRLEHIGRHQGHLGLAKAQVQVIGTGKSCHPTSQGKPLPVSAVINPGVLGRGAVGWLDSVDSELWRMLIQYDKNSSHRSPNDFVFPNSRNRLEDVLGIMSAAAVGDYWGSLEPTSTESITLDGGRIQLPSVRVGSGNWWAVVYTIPSFYSIIMLSFLMIKRSCMSKNAERQAQERAAEEGRANERKVYEAALHEEKIYELKAYQAKIFEAKAYEAAFTTKCREEKGEQ